MAKIILTAQNIDIYKDDNLDQLARTGSTSAEQIYRAGASGVILGHSEVGDIPEIVKKKLSTITTNTSNPDYLEKITLLVGETWDEFQNNSPEVISDIVSGHLKYILDGIPLNYLENITIGYEPKWGSRGSGYDDVPPPSFELITTVCKKLRSTLVFLFNENIASVIPIIYGGRSTPERTEEILSDENIEGLILGSACNSVKKIMDIARVMSEIRPAKRKILHANFKAFNLSDSYEEYLLALNTLDDSFVVYLSPCQTDIREIKRLIYRPQR